MIFFNGSCFNRYGPPTLRGTPCCRDILNSIQLVKKDYNRHKHIPCKKMVLNRFKINLCPSNVCITSGMTFWTQVRFNKDYPRLHRDVEFPNFDAYRKDEYKDVRKTNWGNGDAKPGFTYVIGFFGLLCGSYGLKAELVHFASFMAAAADVLALATIEVEVSKIAPGACASYKWRGKPLFIKHRTPADIESEANTPLSALRDPETPEDRTVKSEWLVVIGICTHLGCVPIPNAGDWPGGFYCPCHGSHYDNVGRARKGPAPLNLEVPLHKFINDNLILVG